MVLNLRLPCWALGKLSPGPTEQPHSSRRPSVLSTMRVCIRHSIYHCFKRSVGDAGACWEGSSALLILLIQMLISEEDVLLDLNPGILALRIRSPEPSEHSWLTLETRDSWLPKLIMKPALTERYTKRKREKYEALKESKAVSPGPGRACSISASQSRTHESTKTPEESVH
ncbi:unnamed protein product [Rangifer tarandus platyrhynchus]|uniref:Uncharacterized protein n=2 Tax=Rangifer tarandus platyrhynchus TaxID=3082113 RepID=A0ABN8ZDK4_RANTA|nr:unnamed protein product [Rangifer tarandus platyrhynchus]CAI9707227.1 unnamed protein product [Rangifer tarandus platyrhynchus]